MFSSSTSHNREVKCHLLKEITGQPDNKYEIETVRGSYIYLLLRIYCIHTAAIKRCYENIRRNHTEQKDGMEDYVINQAKKRKYRSRRQRVFNLIYIYIYTSLTDI